MKHCESDLVATLPNGLSIDLSAHPMCHFSFIVRYFFFHGLPYRKRVCVISNMCIYAHTEWITKKRERKKSGNDCQKYKRLHKKSENDNVFFFVERKKPKIKVHIEMDFRSLIEITYHAHINFAVSNAEFTYLFVDNVCRRRPPTRKFAASLSISKRGD